MSERKLDQIENMFKQTKNPKLEIETVDKIDSFGVILDNTPQGKLALEIATQMAKKLNISLDVTVTEEYYEAFHMLMEGIRKEIKELEDLARSKVEEAGIYSKTSVLVASKVEKALEIFDVEEEEGGVLGYRLVNELEKLDSDLVFMGVPIFRGREENDAENLGGYATKLLRARRIHSNFMLITDQTKPPVSDSILSFVSIEQQPGSIVALTRRGLSLSSENTDISVVGMVEDKVIETVARVDQLGDEKFDEEGNEQLDLDAAREKLEMKMNDTLSSIQIDESLPHKSFKFDVKHGSISGMVIEALEKKKPGMVMVRSVSEISENLDPIAEQISRIVLRAGYPCLIVWD